MAMRGRDVLAAVIATTAGLTGCGYVGPPLPPALNIPTPVSDLSVRQRGEKAVIAFTIPPLTTEGLPLTSLDAVELFAGDKEVPVKAEGPGRVSVETPVTVGEVVFRVRLKNAKGRYSPWSNVVTLKVVAALPRPKGLVAKAAAQGVELTWQAEDRAEVEFRVYRRAEKETQLSEVGRTAEHRYGDTTAEYDKTYDYVVQAVMKETEGEPSEVVSITPKDVFAPAVPSGLTLIAGVGSIELAWDRNGEVDFKAYRIYRGVDGGALQVIADLVETPAYSDRTIESGKRYKYAISAYDQLGNESEKSGAVEIQAP